MQVLEKSLRNQLERVVKEARDVAESAARIALDQLGVGAYSAYAHLTEQQRDLRRRLRIHGRQLGDKLDTNTQSQELTRLVEEVAYEHWHRMLFARFLAENKMLMYPDPSGPVAVTLKECEDLAVEEGARNGWELASRFAARMLPQIFRIDSPVLQLVLPPENQQQMERLLSSLSSEVFQATDSLGWVYQFWQSKKKEVVNNSEVKIGAQELPAVTQLFTEPYMVHFLLDNSLGSWWATRRISAQDLVCAEDEHELRTKASLPGVPLSYLRFVKTEDGKWIPASGSFNQWPVNLKEFKLMDPCCGSGHFLVAAFHMLVPMCMELDNLTESQAIDAVLHNNIFGLELDQRCVELAAFALALNAWTYPNAGGYRPLPNLNIACSGLSVGVAKEEWKQLATGKHNLRIAMDWLYETFKDAPTLGSLINPAKSEASKIVPWNELAAALEQALTKEQNAEQEEAAVVAYGLAKASTLLSEKYHLVITNVPYLARGKQNDLLRNFIEEYYPDSKNDLATVFLERCLDFCTPVGSTCIVIPQNWMFLKSYRNFRKKLLGNQIWNVITRLGPNAFQTPMWDFNVSLFIISNRKSIFDYNQNVCEDDIFISGLDVHNSKTTSDKSNALLNNSIYRARQNDQLINDDMIIRLDGVIYDELLSKYSNCYQGTSAGDGEQLISCFWEYPKKPRGFENFESTPQKNTMFSGKSWYINWVGTQNNPSAAIRGREAWNNRGLILGQMANIPTSIYLGYKFANKSPVIVPQYPQHSEAIFCFCNSNEFITELRKINQKLSVDNGYISKVPFNLEYWTRVAKEKYPEGLPRAFSDDPTQWIFHGYPSGSVIWSCEKKSTIHGSLRIDQSVLQIAIARLLGYRWPTEPELNVELADEQRDWVNRCESLLPFADKDGVVCIPSVRGEPAAADRLLELLAASYGESWDTLILANLLTDADHAGKSLESWLREKFFTQHCKLFQHRPFIWHIWDGLRDGFSVLVNYHKLDKKLLENLIYSYLGDWINRQKQDILNDVDGSQEKLAAAERLKKSLELILGGEAPYDIFVRWKPISHQPIGWDPDINNGVRINIRPFMSVPDVGKKGAGILRDKPNINWNKDRGQDVESAPWYKVFAGERINDHHLTLEEKKAAQSK